MKFEQLQSLLPNMLVYGAKNYPYTFIITCETNMGDKYKNWTGYTASYKHISSKKQSIKIQGRWYNFDEAIEACNETLKNLK